MNSKVSGLFVCAFASTILSAGTVVPAHAADAASTYKAPRNGYGRPDFSGTWTNETLTRMERPAEFGDRLVPNKDELAKLEGAQANRVVAGSQKTNLNGGPGEAFRANCETAAGAFDAQCGYNQAFFDDALHMMRVNGQARSSLITFPANGRIPRRPDPRPRPDGRAVGPRDNPEDRGLPDRCLVGQNISTGALLNPTIYNNTFVFQQNKDAVVIVTEMSHDARTIHIGAQHDNIPRWFGDSVGHWEGDTLVVDTVHFHPEQLTRNSDQLHLTERFTRVGPNRILYQFKVEDPVAYTEAWGGEYEFSTAKGLQYEYACHEGNYALTSILSGAREEEAKAAGKQPIKSASTSGGQ
jgi:hypothetical protein